MMNHALKFLFVTGLVLAPGVAAHAVQIDPNGVTSSVLDLWLAADDILGDNGYGQPADGATVTKWYDKSGNNRDATSGGDPRFETGEIAPSGKPVVRFDGDDYFTLPEFLNSREPTMFVVGKTSGSGVETILGDYGAYPEVISFQLSGGAIRPFIRDSDGDVLQPAGAGDTTDYSIASIALELSGGGTVTARHIAADGTTTQEPNTNANYSSTTWEEVFKTGPNIGRSPWPGNYLTGDIAELIVFADPLSAAEYAGVEEYLYEKYFSLEPKVYYRADNVDGLGNPGDAGTTTLVNLANPGTYDGVINEGSGVAHNAAEAGMAYEYGIELSSDATAPYTYIQTDGYTIDGDKYADDVTWEFWMKSTGGGTGMLYYEDSAGSLPVGLAGYTRHSLVTNSGTGEISFDEWGGDGNVGTSFAPAYNSDEFCQLVVTKVGDTFSCYNNGELQGTFVDGETSTMAAADVVAAIFGARQYGISSFWPMYGQFNIIRLYDRALTLEEVAQNYADTIGVPELSVIPEPSTLAIWSLGLIGLAWYARRRRSK